MLFAINHEGDIVIQVKKRNMAIQLLLLIVTFGLYAIYWFFQTAVELKNITKDEKAAPGLWTMLFFIPFGIIYSYYKYAELFEKVSSEKLNKWIVFLLWIVFVPAVWFIVQRDLNTIADQEKAAHS